MVSSTLLMQELVSKKGDVNNRDEIMSERTESESFKDYAHIHPIETEPVMRINGDQDEDHLEQELGARLQTELEDSENDTPRVARVKSKQFGITNDQLKGMGQPVLRNVDGRITLTFTQITTSLPTDGQLQIHQEPGEIYMNFEKEEKKKRPKEGGARPS